MDFIKIKNFCASKEIINRVKRQSIEWEKYLQNIHMIRGQYLEFVKIFIHFNNRTTQLKRDQKTYIDISPRQRYKWPINTWKDVQLISREMQIKTPMKCHFTHIKMTIIIRKKKHTEIISVDKAVEKLELLCIRGWNIKWYSCCRKQ